MKRVRIKTKSGEVIRECEYDGTFVRFGESSPWTSKRLLTDDLCLVIEEIPPPEPAVFEGVIHPPTSKHYRLGTKEWNHFAWEIMLPGKRYRVEVTEI